MSVYLSVVSFSPRGDIKAAFTVGKIHEILLVMMVFDSSGDGGGGGGSIGGGGGDGCGGGVLKWRNVLKFSQAKKKCIRPCFPILPCEISFFKFIIRLSRNLKNVY